MKKLILFFSLIVLMSSCGNKINSNNESSIEVRDSLVDDSITIGDSILTDTCK